MNINNKIALVTGGGKGIGRAISVMLAERGANIAINYHSNKKQAEYTAEKIREHGCKAHLYRADVSKYIEVEKMVENILEDFDSIDILVNNAGTSGENYLLSKITNDEWHRVIDVNLSGTFNCCKAVVSQMTKGKIVNISSIAGKMGGTIGCHYAASKAGVIGLTFSLATELAPDITVNAVAPGPVDTDLLSPQVKKKLSQMTPFGRIAKPEEIAHTVIFLLENDYVSGEVIDVNAGRYMD
ncbi:MAG: 3-oxoacyl-ACP reductase family protein [Candidatus Thermoplasmatota archaeon]|nr:3-oxoacyl-ACP reductase family protein [Candidatus Thermoplasmatota archaeon]